MWKRSQIPLVWGRFNLGLGVVNVVDCQEELVVVFVDPAAVFGSAVGQNAQHREGRVPHGKAAPDR